MKTYRPGQPIEYQYKKNGMFQIRFSNTISSVGIRCETSFQQLVSIENLDQKFYEILENGFQNCTNLTSVTFNGGLSSLNDYAFFNCPSLPNVVFPSHLKTIKSRVFKQCSSLRSVSFQQFDEEANDQSSLSSDFQLSYLGEEVFDACPQLNNIVFPTSLSSQQCFAPTTFKGSSIQDITFLGIPSQSEASRFLVQSKMLGIGHDCNVVFSDKRKFLYSNSVNTLIEDYSYNSHGSLEYAKTSYMRLRKPYLFSADAMKWIIDPSSRDQTATKFPDVPCPVIVMYGDFLTSSTSRRFLSEVIEAKEFQKQLESAINCYVLVLSRDGLIDLNSSSSNDLYYFRKELNASKAIQRSFMSLNFYYKDSFTSLTTTTTSIPDVIKLIQQGASQTGFDSFQFEDFDIKLEPPYDEQIASGSPNVDKNYVYPWWWDGSSAMTIPEWK